jgi:lantibiotic modifying enzyme
MGVSENSVQRTLARAAEAIADELAETAIVEGEQCTWLSSAVEVREGERCVVHRTGEPSVYDGDAGIAWALAAAARSLERDDLADIARAGAVGALQRADPLLGGGLYDGAAGVAVAVLQVGAALGDDRLSAQGVDLLEAALEPRPVADDLISGAAGSIVGALAAEAVTGDQDWLGAATGLARGLVERAQRRSWGWSWPSGEPGEPGLCGLAHGSAGIAWALGEVAARAGSDEFAGPVREALRYEESWFDRTRSNWPDLRLVTRDPDGTRAYPAWWCHGAAGAGLVRLRLWDLGIDEPALLAQAGAAFRATFENAAAPLRDGRAGEFGLTVCHGLAGAVELFLTAHEVLDEDEHLVTASWLLERAVALLGPGVEWWPDGTGGIGAGPGLMTGMAGTLVVLLRAIEPRRLPSVALFPLGRQRNGARRAEGASRERTTGFEPATLSLGS